MQGFLDFGIGYGLSEIRIELLNYRKRRAGRHKRREPENRIDGWQSGFRERRNIRQVLYPLGRCDGERAKRAAFDMRNRGRRPVNKHRYVTAYDPGDVLLHKPARPLSTSQDW